MAKVADVKLFWSKSPSQDIAKVTVTTTINGVDTVAEFGPEVEEMQIEVAALGTVQFQIVVTDTEGKVASSEIHSFTLGDLEDPLPATNLGHEILGVRDVA
jgi:hypothetical protein